jgi:trimeric autotransporter adhesin
MATLPVNHTYPNTAYLTATLNMEKREGYHLATMCSQTLRYATGFVAFFMSCAAAFCQSDSLALSSGVVAPGGTVTLNLSLTSLAGSQPAGLQWTLTFDPSQIVAINASAGPSAAAAGATLTCAAATGAYTCLLDGMSSNLLQNGVVATVAVTVAASASTTALAVANPLAASLAASAIPVTGIGGTITVSGSSPLVLTSVVCNPSSLATPSNTTCTAVLSGQVASGNTAVVALSSTSSYLTVPASVMVPGGASAFTFAASAASVPNNLATIVTATLGSSSQTANLALEAPASATLSSLQCAPANLNSGGTGTCTVSLSQSVLSTTTVALASNNAVLTVPASLSVPAGAATANFAAKAGNFTAGQQAVVTATLGGSTQTATFNLVSGIGISFLQCAISNLGLNSATACMVMLSQPAQSGATIILSSNDTALTVPASAVVTAGQTAVGFTATTGTFTTTQTAVITATLGSSSLTTSETLVPPLALASVQCSPSSLSSGNNSTCVVTLNQLAPSSISVALSDNNASLSVPTSVTVSSGASSANFTATAGIVSTTQSVTITATLNSASQTATLSLVAPILVSGLACNPTSVNSGTSTTCTVTLSQAAGSGGSTVGLSSNNTALTVPASVTVPANSTSATFTASLGTITTTQTATVTASLSGSSQNATLSLITPTLVSSLACSPTSVNSGASTTCTVTLTQAAPSGGSTVGLSGNNTTLTVPASVTVPANSTSATFTASLGTITTTQTATVTASLGGSSQSTTLSLVAPTLVSSLACSPTSVNSGASTTCTVTLTQAAPSGGSTVGLSSNNTALTVPASITVPANSTSATFTASLGTITTTQTATVTASLSSSSQSTTLSLVAPTLVSSLACSPTSVNSGASTTCTVTLTQAAPSGGNVVALCDNNALLAVPASVTVAAGVSSATFAATAGTFTTTQSATITATLNSASQTTTLNLINTSVIVSALACNSTSLDAGASSTCTLTLSAPAPAGGATVSVSANSPALAVPASATVPVGSSTATFTATATTILPVGESTQTVLVTATLNGASQSESFTLIICPCGLWPSTAQPVNPASTNKQAVEVGMQFTSAISGFLTGVQFFKASTNGGTHLGNLWTSEGTQLAQVTFTNETSSGWQAAYFASPIAITANTTYVISYHAPQGHTAADNGSFTTPVSNLPLQGLANGQSVPNGVYKSGSSGFPTTASSATNYWVDVIFNTSATIGTAPPVSVWASTAIPKTPAVSGAQAEELGLTFMPDVPGYITGVRFYKGSKNLGKHIGYLWTAAGTLLASVTFTNESASGWQQANFATPVAVNANTAYVISYWSPKGHYADDTGYFATSGVTSQMLYAPPNGQYGPNGPYATNHVFPTSSANANNYLD